MLFVGFWAARAKIRKQGLAGSCADAVPSIHNMKRFSRWCARQLVFACRRIYAPVKDHGRIKPLLTGMTYLDTDVGTTRSLGASPLRTKERVDCWRDLRPADLQNHEGQGPPTKGGSLFKP